ncbi:hypothetical protein ACWDZ4_17685 [Streptomyces sp. NPDC003016]
MEHGDGAGARPVDVLEPRDGPGPPRAVPEHGLALPVHPQHLGRSGEGEVPALPSGDTPTCPSAAGGAMAVKKTGWSSMTVRIRPSMRA